MPRNSDTRDLTLHEKQTLICVLAEARTAAYQKCADMRRRSNEMEDNGESGYNAFDNEAESHEIAAGTMDDIIDLICEGRILIIKRDAG